MRWMIAGLSMCLIPLGVVAKSSPAKATQTEAPIPTVISAEKSATISSPMSGKITVLPVKEGSHFKKGETLLQFDCDIEKAHLRKAKAELSLAKQRFLSNQHLKRLNSVSHFEVAESAAKYERAKADFLISEKKVSFCEIKAPYDGHVVSIMVNEHETIEFHQQLFSIISSDKLVVEVMVPSEWLEWVKVGSPFTVLIKETNKKYQVKVLRIVKQVDAISQSIKIIGALKNGNAELKPGMSGMSYFNRENDG